MILRINNFLQSNIVLSQHISEVKSRNMCERYTKLSYETLYYKNKLTSLMYINSSMNLNSLILYDENILSDLQFVAVPFIKDSFICKQKE